MEKFKITLTDVIIIATVLIIVVVCTIIGSCKEKGKAKMSVDTHRGIDGFVVNVETQEDIYNTLDGMHTQAMMELGENHKMTMWLADKMDELHQKFDLDEDKLMEP